MNEVDYEALPSNAGLGVSFIPEIQLVSNWHIQL